MQLILHFCAPNNKQNNGLRSRLPRMLYHKYVCLKYVFYWAFESILRAFFQNISYLQTYIYIYLHIFKFRAVA